mgnify:CR=1 FL=1
MAEKLFYSMGEVAEMFDVNASLIRHWESQFSVIRPKRNKKGNRLFSPQDVENLKLIYHLVKERGMTLEGAKKALKQKPAAEGGVQRDAELMERLQRIRALLAEVREDLKAGEGEILAGADAEVPAAEAGATVPRRKAKPVVKIVPEDAAAQGAAEPSSFTSIFVRCNTRLIYRLSPFLQFPICEKSANFSSNASCIPILSKTSANSFCVSALNFGIPVCTIVSFA